MGSEDAVPAAPEATAGAVAPDGSPVAVYLALPVEPEYTPVLQAVSERASVLDLGCGVGRLAAALAARGHDVVGVDESAAMLAHLPAAVTGIRARIEELDLRRRFDAVVLGSHFVNVADGARRHALLVACARHVAPGGVVYVERYAPGWITEVRDHSGRAGLVGVRLRVLARRGQEFDGRATYTLGGRAWHQEFTACALDDAALDAALGAAGLERAGMLDVDRTWVVARPDHRRRPG